jgi:hypothetical protein
VELTAEGSSEALRKGELELLGRMAWSSNATFLVNAALDGVEVPAVYKPQRGERPLWDFPDGTLCSREVATYEVSDALGWDLVPETVLRDGPYGLGMVQRFVEHDPDEHYFALLPHHPDELLRFAVFDVIVNNADRKGGHILHGVDDGVYGVDHGLCLHSEDKLRTVLWGWAGKPVDDDNLAAVDKLMTALNGDLAETLEPHITVEEIVALLERARDLLDNPVMPGPDRHRPIPWPAF